MPKLVLFAACEKVLLDQQNVLSLIGLIQELKIQVPESGPVPQRDATGPIRWDVVTLWEGVASDTGKQFDQRLALFDPAGQATAVSAVSKVEAKEGAMHRTFANVFGFPIGSTGRYVLKLWLSENGQESPQPIAEYSITVVHDVLKK